MITVTNYSRWISAAVVVIALGALFTYLDLPAGWLIAGMLGAASVALLSRRELTPPAKAMSAAQGVIGVVAVEPLTKLTPSDLVHFAGCAAFSVSVTLTLSVVLGLLLARLAKDLGAATANLSLIAGGASTISSMAKELGADERYVALSQYLRLTIVVLTMPVVLSALGTRDTAPELVAAHDHWSVVGLVAMAALIVAAGRGAKLIRLPAPFLLGPLVVTAALAVADPSLATLVSPTTVITDVAYVVIGWQAGGGFAVDVLRRFVRLIPLTLGFIALTIGSCFGVAVIVSHWAGVSLSDAYLATTPGGIYGVLAIANEVHSGPIVVTLQVLRLITMVVAAGMIPKLVGWLSQRRGRAGGAAVNSCSGRPVVPYLNPTVTSPAPASVAR
ncbi:AbrB family transcriptional regulator [Mycolicibacterium arenosum]|uniref:AbrB family transcriptional regulator n=1 Tax=Mycolicibacterium arenosum TaxID=2952157 RepID=A0ABT1M6R6_9MYCO|nr:AbrB family transcriptional regulator [Mycolicibacterium sp. CAU 1645]MCP9274861.1 AbrB family transcriptional regulator [Mycolicibacterium sp. CAU 1645]